MDTPQIHHEGAVAYMAVFNRQCRYTLILNLLIGVVLIPFFLASSVRDAFQLRLAGNILPTESEYARREPPLNRGIPNSRAVYDEIVRRDIFNLAALPAIAPVEKEALA